MNPRKFKELNIKYKIEYKIIRSLPECPKETNLIKDIFYFKYKQDSLLLPKINEIYFVKGIKSYYIRYIHENTDFDIIKDLIKHNLVFA